jgi:hypothetical protein
MKSKFLEIKKAFLLTLIGCLLAMTRAQTVIECETIVKVAGSDQEAL